MMAKKLQPLHSIMMGMGRVQDMQECLLMVIAMERLVNGANEDQI